MNRKKRCLFFASLLFAGICSSVPALSQSEQDDRPRIICILPSKFGIQFWQDIAAGIQEQAKQNQVDLTMLYTEFVEEHVSIDLNRALKIAILTETQGIVLADNNNDEEMNCLLLEARAQGIPIILLDCDINNSLRDAYIGIDNEQAGKALAEYVIASIADNKGVFLCYSASLESQANTGPRIQGIRSAFSDPSKLGVYVTPADIDEADKISAWESFLTDHPDIGAMITLTEKDTILASQILARQNLTDQIQLFGFDLTEKTQKLLDNGSLSAIVAQNHQQMGRQSIEVMMQLLSGQTLESDTIYIDYQLRTSP